MNRFCLECSGIAFSVQLPLISDSFLQVPNLEELHGKQSLQF